VTDQTSNNVTIVEVVERLAGPIPPPEQGIGVLGIQLDFLTLWARSDFQQGERGRARTRFLGPDDASLGEPTVYAVVLDEFPRLRNISRFGGVPYVGAGVYKLVIEKEVGSAWEEVARYPLEITSTLPIVSVANPVQSTGVPPGNNTAG
jgi:hypothetical protein